MSTAPVILWDGDNYQGNFASVQYGQYGSMSDLGLADKSVSSVRVLHFTKLTLYELPNFGGRFVTVLGPAQISTLANYGAGFQNIASSVRCDRLQPPAEWVLGCCRGINPISSCGEYAPGSAACASATANYCATNIKDPYCKQWCVSNPAVCDAGAIAFCAANPTDPFCACINSPASKVANPKCVDRQCVLTGYLTSNMQSVTCPPSITCEVKTQLNNTGIMLTDIPVSQNCGGSAPTVVGESTINPLMILVIALMIFITVMGSIAIARKLNSSDIRSLR